MSEVVRLAFTRRAVSTISEAIKTLGGLEVVASDCSCRVAKVKEWIEHDQIPVGWHFRLYLRLTSMGYEPDLSGVFGMLRNGRPDDRPPWGRKLREEMARV